MKYNWKTSAIILVDIVLGCYLFLAITAFNKPDDQKTVCTKVFIDIEEGNVEGFLGATEIKEQLQREKIYPQGQPLHQVDVRKIEETIRRNPFVETAECYKTQGGHVRIKLSQRMPVMRIKADSGDDYYVDTHGEIMPNTRFTSNMVIATGSITRPYAKEKLARIGNLIAQNNFWQSLIEQLNVLPDSTIEMIPRIGDHVVYLGSATKIQQKLDRLEKFYRYGLSEAGWNKYSYINLEFDNQIICKKRKKNK